MDKHIHNSFGVAIAIAGVAAITTPTTAQGFTHQDLYLASPGLPLPEGGYGIGILRIDPGTWSETFITPPPGYDYQARPAYDAFRDRLILTSVGDDLIAMDSLGASATISLSGTLSVGLVAPTGDGRVYVAPYGSGDMGFVDESDVEHTLLGTNGVDPYETVAATVMHYDAATDSIFLADNSAANVLTIKRLSLNAAGDQVTSVDSTTYDVSIAGEVAVGMNAGPSGSIFIKVDDNSSNTNPRMLTVDPQTLDVSVYAQSGYGGVGGEVGGAFSSWLNQAVVVDSVSDVLRVFSQGQAGAGSIVLSEIGFPGGSGGSITLIEVLIPSCAADSNSDGVVDGADLAGLLAAWGTNNPLYDLNGDNIVDGADLAAMLAAWGACA